jgi:hypothetical protein
MTGGVGVGVDNCALVAAKTRQALLSVKKVGGHDSRFDKPTCMYHRGYGDLACALPALEDYRGQSSPYCDTSRNRSSYNTTDYKEVGDARLAKHPSSRSGVFTTTLTAKG